MKLKMRSILITALLFILLFVWMYKKLTIETVTVLSVSESHIFGEIEKKSTATDPFLVTFDWNSKKEVKKGDILKIIVFNRHTASVSPLPLKVVFVKIESEDRQLDSR